MSVIAIASGRAVSAMANNDTSTRTNRDNVMTGALPDDFLRINGPAAVNPMVGGQPMMFGGMQQAGGILSMTIVQARLAKNYGVTRMDPFCRIRVGMQVFETTTAYNGSKTPRWNKIMQCQLPEGIKEFYFEIYDERTFQVDERIAWGMIAIKDEVFSGENVDDWYSLSGKQGDEKEGCVNIVLSYRKNGPVMMGGPMLAGNQMVYPSPMMYPTGGYMYGYPQVMYAPGTVVQQFPPQPGMPPQQPGMPPQQLPHQQPPPQVSEKDLKTLKEMCPNMDDEIIGSVLQQAGGNIDRAAALILEMAGEQ